MKPKVNPKPHCKQPAPIRKKFDPAVSGQRLSYILTNSSKWVNGTDIKFIFIEGPEKQKKVVRKAFQVWKALGIGLSFTEVKDVAEAMVRIGFNLKKGSWSYVGREVLTIPKKERTMNFGWDLAADAYGMTTALHEIGHTIGFQHEHQSPFAGIEWDMKAVYKEFSGDPNFWSKHEIDLNIINKLSPNQTKGSAWDPKSIMEYEFGPGLILKPVQFKNGIPLSGVISVNDTKGVKAFYPEINATAAKKIAPQKALGIKASSGGQADFIFTAPFTKKYTFETSGHLDTVMVISEKGKKENYYLAGDDDSGLEKNAKITLPLVKGRSYLVNIRVMYAPAGKTGALVVS